MPASPSTTSPGLASQLVVGGALLITDLAMTISFAALVFTAELADGLPRAASTFVLGAGVANIIIGLRSSLTTALSTAQDVAAIVLLATAASIIANDAADPVASMFAVLAISATAFGLVALVLDRARLTSVAQFLPSSVITGFVAGTGWLLFSGGIQVAINERLGLAGLARDLADHWRFLLPALVVCLAVTTASLVEAVPRAVVGLVVIVAIVAFYLIVGATSSVDDVADGGWLIGPFGDIGRWRPLSPADVTRAELPPFWESLTSIAAVVLVSVIGMLLNVKSIIGGDAEGGDLGHEVRSVGFSNLLIGPIGGLISYHGLGDSTLAQKAGVQGRAVPVAVGVVGVGVGLFGATFIGYVPRMVVGGMLAGLGAILLVDSARTVLRSRSVESVVSAVILLVIMFVGVLEGVGAGMLAATAIFVVRYSKIDPIRTRGTGRDFTSSVERSDVARASLYANADRLLVFRMHGYLFFGSFESVEGEVLAAVDEADVAVVILDFHHVSGLDASASESLVGIADRARAHGILMLWSGLGERLLAQVTASEGATDVARLSDLDHALEVAEGHLLDQLPPAESAATSGLSSALETCLETVCFEDGDQIVALGDSGRELFIVAEGRCEASLPGTNGTRQRLREFGAGSIIGEVTFRSGDARTADIHAKGPVRLLSINRQEYEALALTSPELAIELSDRMLEVSSHRVADLSQRLGRELS